MENNLSITVLNLDLGISKGTTGTDALGAGIGADRTKAGQSLDFTATLQGLASDVSNSLEKAEAMSIAGIKGEAGAYEVASAVMEAEQALRMTISVRDKIVQAYLDITRMQI